MGRVILFELLIFLLPFLAFAAWAYVKRGDDTTPLFDDAPVFWLSVVGLVGVVIGFLSFSSLERTGTDVVYEPARMEDGRVVPGRALPRDQVGAN
ncbi:hypothetical protein MNBD_ALPHA09-926 [hydrothermal vent metagenome]|uniref:Uncharacterized protein n=1 Tax=hydrothermal vent metagenome TaxID=652676 RepID=A0A3B0TRA5_9ZZZZ